MLGAAAIDTDSIGLDDGKIAGDMSPGRHLLGACATMASFKMRVEGDGTEDRRWS